MADLLNLLAILDSDPDDAAALAALQAQAAQLDGPAVEAVAATRLRMRERGRPERAVALLALELGAARSPADRIALTLEKARILDEELLDAPAATAAYKEVLALDKKHEDAGDAQAQLALGKKNDNWKKFAAKFTAEATAASDRTLATSLYLSAAEQWGRFAPGKPEMDDLLRRALEADPGNRRASLHLERSLRAAGRWAELAALVERRAGQAASPLERIDAALDLADLAHDHLGDDPRALALGRQVLATDPAHPRAIRRVAHALEAQGDWAGLAAVYAAALKVKGDGDGGLVLQTGMILWRHVGDLDAAEDYFRRLRRIDPAHPAALDFYRAYHGGKNEPAKLVAILRQAEKSLPPAGTSPATDIRARALAIEIAELSETGTPDKAIDAWKQMLRLDPTSSEAREALKRLYHKAERWNALLDLLKDEAERLPADDLAGRKARLFEMIAIYRDRLRQDPMVINTYNAVLKLDPDDARAADELAAKYRAMARWQDLINVLGRKAELTSVPLPTRVALLREVADLWLERFNNHAQAVRPLERLIELAPSDLDAINRLKDIYGKRRQWRPLIGLLGREAELLTGTARHTKLAEMARLAAERAGDPRLAIEIHNRLIAEHGDGGDDETLAALAALYERDKRWLALAEILDRQRKRAKRPAEAVALLEKIGAILADRAHAPAAAAQVWSEILTVDPGHGKALRTLRELYAAAGDWDGLEGLYGKLGQWDELVDALFALGDRQDDRAVRLGLFRRAAAIAGRKPDSDRLVRAWERVLAVEPHDADAARALIPAYTRGEKWAKLLPLREALLAQAPDDAARLAELSEIRTLTEHKLGSRALALAWTARAFDLAPDDPTLADELLRLAQQPEQWREVAAVLGRAADDPARPLATRMRLLRTLAELYGTQLDDDDAARAAQRKLLALTPDDPAAALAYEELSERLADWPELLASLRRRNAAATGADRRALLARIATIEEEKLADLDAAAITVGQILALAPGDAPTLAALARLHEARGDWDGLATVLRTQLATEPGAAGGRGALHLRLGALEEGLDRPAQGLEHYLAALALAAEGAADAPPEQAAIAACVRYLDPAGPGRALDDVRRREVAAAVEPYLRRAADAATLARALEVLAGGAAPGTAPALAIDRRLVGLYHQLAQPERAWDAAVRVVAGDPADDEARASLTALAHDLGRAPQLAEHVGGALAARRQAGATATEIRALAAELAHLHAEELGDLAGAERAWQVVLEVEPDDAEAFTALADLYRQGERWAELRALLERRATAAVAVDERRSALIEIATLDEEIAADATRAIDTYRRLLDVDPAYLPAYKALDRLHGERHEWAELDAILERSFDSAPAAEQVTLLYRRAALHAHHLADPTGAVDLLEDVVTRAPGHADARELLEELLAVPSLRQRVAVMLEPLYTRDKLWKDLTGVLRIQREAADSPLQAVELLARVAAVEEDELGNLRAAFDTWAQALAADPSEPRPAAALTRLAARTDRWGDAARALDEAATGVEPHVAIPLLRQLAEIADISLGDNPRAIAAYHRLHQAAPNDAEVAGPALVALAGLYKDEEQWAELDRVLHLHADSAPTADARAGLLAQAAELEEQQLQDRAAAIATWNQLLADDADDLDALLALERLYQADDRWKELADNLRRQADRAEAPADRIALLRRMAEIHEVMLEDQDQAIAATLEILDHDGEDAAALDELARLYHEQQRPADRFDILERRLALADGRGEADTIARRHELAVLLAGPLGREPEALDRWAEVLARDPGHAAALAAVQRALGDPDLAPRATAILEPLYEATGRDLELTELLWQTAARDSSVRDRLQRQVRVAQIRERRLGDKAGAFAAAIAAVRTAVAEPELPELLAELDRLAADLGREADLIAVYRDIADDVLDGELQRRLFLDIADLARAISHDTALAARYYHKVLDSQPDDRRALGALEAIYRQGQQGEPLYAILGQKVELTDTDPLERKAALAEMAALAGGPLGRTDDAITAWSAVLEIDPSDVAAATALEALYRDQCRWADLIDLYERRLGFVDSLDEAVALRIKAGQIHEAELRDLTAAAESYAAALSGDPTEPTALAALERMLTEVDVRAQAAEVLEPIYISRQDWPKLVRIYEVRLDAAGDPAERLELTRQIARLHEEQLEDLEAAFGWHAKVLREDPSEPEVRGQLHRLATILDLWPQLAAVYQGVLDDDRGDSPHLRAIAADAAEIYDRRLDRWEPGADAYLRALAGFVPGDDDLPSLPELFTGLEELLTRHRQWRPLATAYGDAILAIDDEAWRRTLQARQAALLEHRLGDADGAIDAWRGVLASAADAGDGEAYGRAAVELDRLYRAGARWFDLAELLGERLQRAGAEAGQPDPIELRLALAAVLETQLHDASAAIDQYQEVLASAHPEPAATALERLLADPDQRGRAAELLEPYYRRRDAWPRLVALLEHQVPHQDDPESKIVALLEVSELHDVRGGDQARALDALARAWQIEPARRDVFELLIAHGARMGAWDELVAILERGAAATLEPEAAAMALARVAELHEGPRGDRAAAIAAWRKVLTVATDDPAALAALDRLLEAAQRPAELVTVVERRAELAEEPAVRLALLHRVAGLYEEVLQQPREAVAAYKNVLAADDTDATALDALDRLYRQLAQPRELAQLLERKLELAEDAAVRRGLRLDLAGVAERDLGDGYEAMNQLQAVLAEDPTDDVALGELDRLYGANRMWPELLDILERRSTLADDPAEHAELEFRAAQLSEHELAEPEHAIARYGEVLALVPGHAGARAALEGLLAQDGHLDAAADLLERHHRDHGDHDALVKVLERRLDGATDPEDRRNLWASLADVHETLRGDLAAAAATWARALVENPADRALIGPLERLATVRGAWAELATLLEGRLQTGLDPELEHDYAMRLGKILEEHLQDPGKAAAAYQRAAATMVDESAALVALDRVLWRLGRWPDLARVLERLAELADDAQAADLTFRLGDVRETQLKDLPGAVAAYRAVIDRDRGHQAARASLERLLGQVEHERSTIIDTLEPLYEADGDWLRLIDVLTAKLGVVDDGPERASIYQRIANLAETRAGDVGRALDAAAGWLAEDPSSGEALAEVDRLAGRDARWFDVAGWVEEIAGKAGDGALPLWMYAGTVELDRLGDPTRATASFHQALALDADHVPALEALERTHRSMGEVGPLAGVLARQAALAFDPVAKIELWREVAALREQSDDDDGAIAAWEAVVELADGDGEPLAHLARIHERRGDRRALIHDLTRAAQVAGGGDAEKALRVRIATLESELGDPAAAASAWQAVLDLDPADGAALAALEAVHVAAKDWMAVQDLLARRLDLARTSGEKAAVLTRMAELAERERGAVDDAIAHWYAVLDVDSSLQPAYDQLERLLAKSSRWHDLVELLERRADVHGTLGDSDAELRALARAADIWEGPLDNPDEAGDILEKILRREPGSVAALTRLARIHERTGDRAKATEVLERALALGPTGRDAADLFFRLGEIAGGVDGDPDTARAHYRQALVHDVGHAGAITALEALAREARDWPVVADMLERRAAAIAAGGEGDPTALAIELATVYGRVGEPARALPALERAAAAAPGDARVLAPLADLYVAAGQLDRAAPIVERLADEARAGKRMKDVARYRQRQGAILEARGDAAGAMAAYDEAFRIAPTDVPTMAGLGRLAMAARDWEKARRVYRALVLQNLDDSAGVTKAGVYLALGQIHVELGEAPKAKGMFQRGLELEPTNAALKDALAKV